MSKKPHSSRGILNELLHKRFAFLNLLIQRSHAWFFLALIIVILTNSKYPNFYSEGLYQNLKSYSSPKNLESKFLALPSLYPQKIINSTFPPLTTAKSIFIVDPLSSVVLYSKNETSKLLPASTTKLMTAVVALESCNIDQVVSVKREKVDGTIIGLSFGELITVKDLLSATLIASANDAAFALADNCSEGYESFLQRMNQKALQLNMKNTHFSNPAGLDSVDLYSTAQDLSKLARVAFLESPIIEQISNVRTLTLNNTLSNKTYPLTNLNELLFSLPGVIAGKTGTTDGAGQNLITLTNRQGKELIVVVLGSQNRFEEASMLIEWAYANFEWVEY